MKQLKSKFIEDTNEQFSIREDAIIIKNYFNKNTPIGLNQIVIVEYNKVRFRINNKTYRFNLRKLMDKYFGFNYCIHCNKKYIREGDSYACDNCKKNNKKKKDYLNNKKYREEISKIYVASKLSINVNQVTDELHYLYKKTLELKREVSKKYNIQIKKL